MNQSQSKFQLNKNLRISLSTKDIYLCFDQQESKSTNCLAKTRTTLFN
jgi:hypothetical protein